jgi:DNA polymerase-1
MDVHCKTAADFYHKEYEEVLSNKKKEPYKSWRQQSKAVNFGAPGGLGPPALSEYARTTYGVELPVPEAKIFLDKFKKKIWPDVGQYLRDQGNECQQFDGRLVTAYNNMGRMKAGCLFTQACNYPFQSLGADAAKWALWNLTRIRLLSWYAHNFNPKDPLADHPLRGSYTVNFVHDEIVMEHPEALAKEAYKEQERIMLACLAQVAVGVKPTCEGSLSAKWGH